MAALASASFESWLIEHVRRFFAETCERLGTAGTRSFVNAMAARARGHGLSKASDICSYVDLACTFGADFDSVLPWADAILSAAAGRASTITMDRLHEAAMEALEAGVPDPSADAADVAATDGDNT